MTDKDIVSLAKTMLQSKPSLAALGDITKIPSYDEIVNGDQCLREPSKLFFSR